MQQYLQNKKGLVQNVFNKVYDKYDLMNDFMSLGIHRLWKKNLINWMAPSEKRKLIDSFLKKIQYDCVLMANLETRRNLH